MKLVHICLLIEILIATDIGAMDFRGTEFQTSMKAHSYQIPSYLDVKDAVPDIGRLQKVTAMPDQNLVTRIFEQPRVINTDNIRFIQELLSKLLNSSCFLTFW